MKKLLKGLFAWCFLALVMSMVTSCGYAYAESTYDAGERFRKSIANVQVRTQEKAEMAYPVPNVNNFMERKTIHDWTERWDVTNKPCYVYVFVGDRCLGYFISNGKPASTQSYLIPEEYDLYDVSRSGTHMNKQSMDIDGTYGSNNPGIRMFLASGQAVEFGGYNISYSYSDQPIPALSENCLGK